MSTMNKKNTGFTLVELLIVIVVIAILAAITVVAYNGITDRAKKAVIQSDLADAAKHLQLYAVDYGGYPQNATDLMSPGADSTDPPLKKATFARNPDPYHWVLYCTDGTDYILAARQLDSTSWFAVGSNYALKPADVAGTSGSGATTCRNLGMSVTTYNAWIKSNSGWSGSLK